MLPLGTRAPNFNLPDTDGSLVSLAAYQDAGALVVMFICNHCPYVKHVQQELVRVAKDYAGRGVGFVAISSNNAAAYPDDGPDKMKEEKQRVGYPFAYLYDESQEVARAYRAACTPDFFVFDDERLLVYRGQLDDSRPKNERVTTEQIPSIGCNIKWKPGNEPEYFGIQTVRR
jgi:peroxiredoxin